jgi:hypothetical protein
MAGFRNLMLDLPSKYKMLWFAVDRPYRQRYFFICGCKQTVTFQARLQPMQEKKNLRFESPRFSFRCKTYPAPSSGCITNQGQAIHKG